MNFFRKKALSKAASLENLDKLLTVVTIKGWLVLSFFCLLFAGVLFWAFMGKIPITTSGKALLFDPDHFYIVRSQTVGIVKEVHKIGGDEVKKDEVIAILHNDDLSWQIDEQKKYISILQQEGRDNSSSSTKELLSAKEKLKDLQKRQAGLIIKAPAQGSLVWMNLFEGDSIEQNQVVLTMQASFSPKDLKIFAFIPRESGQFIKPGMEAKCSMDRFNTEEYGMILGKVEKILPYPINPQEYYLQKISSDALIKYLMGNELSNILVIIKPTIDQTTPSGLAWTSGKGPPKEPESLSLGEARITLGKVRPISYVLPSVK